MYDDAAVIIIYYWVLYNNFRVFVWRAPVTKYENILTIRRYIFQPARVYPTPADVDWLVLFRRKVNERNVALLYYYIIMLYDVHMIMRVCLEETKSGGGATLAVTTHYRNNRRSGTKRFLREIIKGEYYWRDNEIAGDGGGGG